jgi:hypothetical protein
MVNPFMKKITVIFWLGLFTVSCEKTSDNAAFTGSYSLSSSMSVEPIRMYTANGRITDKKVIREFLTNLQNRLNRQHDDSSIAFSFDLLSYFYFDTSTQPVADDVYCHITFNYDKAVIKTKLYNLSTFGKDVDAEVMRFDPLIILTGSVGNVYHEKPTNINDYFDEENIEKIRTFMGTPAPLPLSGFDGQSPMRQNHPLILQNSRLFIPVLSYLKWRSDDPDNSQMNAANVWNILNDNIVNNLTAHDTIVVQESKIELLR